MTFEQKLKELLYQHGLFEKQAEAIVEQMKTAPENEAMQGRWDDDISGYPPVMVNIMWMGAKHTAAEWMEKNMPQHFMLPFFKGELAV